MLRGTRVALRGWPKMTSVERERSTVLVKNLLAGKFDDKTTVEMWKKGGFATKYGGETMLNVQAVWRVLEIPCKVEMLARRVAEFMGEGFVFKEEIVLAFMRKMVEKIRVAKRQDVLCVPGTKTYELVSETHRLFQFFKGNGHGVGLKAWTVMIQGASTAKFSTLVRFLIREMRQDGFDIDVFVGTMAISSFRATASAKPDVVELLRRDCLSIWGYLIKIGSKSTPDTKCYAAMISTLNSFGDTIHSRQIYDQMISKGFTPTVEVYTSLIGSVESEQRLHEVIREMTEKNVKIDSKAFSAILTALRKVAVTAEGGIDVTKAESVFEAAISQGVVLDEWVCNSLLLVYRDTRNPKKAAKFFARMVNDLKITPTASSINFILESCLSNPSPSSSRIAAWAYRYALTNSIYTHHTFGFMMRLHNLMQDYEGAISTYSTMKSLKVLTTLHHLECLRDAHRSKGDEKAAQGVEALPLWSTLKAKKEGMTTGRVKKAALRGILEEADGEGNDVTSKPPPVSQKRPSTPPLPKDAVARGLAELADRIEGQPVRNTPPQTRFAIDDVLGI